MMRQLRLFESENTVVTVNIPGDLHCVAADVLMAQLERALRSVALTGGQSVIVVESSGRVWVNERLVYEPPVRRTQTA